MTETDAQGRCEGVSRGFPGHPGHIGGFPSARGCPRRCPGEGTAPAIVLKAPRGAGSWIWPLSSFLGPHQSGDPAVSGPFPPLPGGQGVLSLRAGGLRSGQQLPLVPASLSPHPGQVTESCLPGASHPAPWFPHKIRAVLSLREFLGGRNKGNLYGVRKQGEAALPLLVSTHTQGRLWGPSLAGTCSPALLSAVTLVRAGHKKLDGWSQWLFHRRNWFGRSGVQNLLGTCPLSPPTWL